MTCRATRPSASRRPAFVATALLLVVLVLLLAGPVGSAAAASPAADTTTPVKKAWTIMIYLDADNNLEEMATPDIENEFCVPGSNADVNVVTIVDRVDGYDDSRGDWTDTKLFYCTRGMLANPESAVADWGECNMGDPETLSDFIIWAKTNYPADHYMISFWDHGYSWYPDYSNMWDETDKAALSEDTFASAMQTAGPVDVVAWDCCLRQMIEVGATFRPYAKAMVGSEEETNWEGLQYDKFIASLQKYPTWNAEQLANDMAATAKGDSACMSSVNLDARWDALMTAVDEWSLALIDGLSARYGSPRQVRKAYDAARAHTQYVWGHYTWDLYDAAFQIKKRVKSPVIRAKSQAVMDAVNVAVGYNWVRSKPMWGMNWRKAHGLAIWWPKYKGQLDPQWTRPWSLWNNWTYYTTVMAFGIQTHWDEFLAMYTRDRK